MLKNTIKQTLIAVTFAMGISLSAAEDWEVTEVANGKTHGFSDIYRLTSLGKDLCFAAAASNTSQSSGIFKLETATAEVSLLADGKTHGFNDVYGLTSLGNDVYFAWHYERIHRHF